MTTKQPMRQMAALTLRSYSQGEDRVQRRQAAARPDRRARPASPIVMVLSPDLGLGPSGGSDCMVLTAPKKTERLPNVFFSCAIIVVCFDFSCQRAVQL
jgi:hypothetical protein